jgi:GT2 family glycosyltransferase
MTEASWETAVRATVSTLWEQPIVGMGAAHRLERVRNQYRSQRHREVSLEPQSCVLVAIRDHGLQNTGPHLQVPWMTARVQTLLVSSSNESYTEIIWKQVADNPADIVVLQGVSMPLAIAGLLYKLTWGALVLVESSQPEESHRQAHSQLTIDELKMRLGGLPKPLPAHSPEWMAIALHSIHRFDGSYEDFIHKSPAHCIEQNWHEIDGGLLNSLESLAPRLASPLMAARYWKFNLRKNDWQYQEKKNRVRDLVSIVIPVYGDSTELDGCLHSLREHRGHYEWEVIAVMNDESPQNCDIITKHSSNDPRIRAIWPRENMQFALGSNLGFSASKGEYLVCMNNDCRARKGWLDELIKPLEGTDVAATQPRLLREDGTVQCLGVVFHEGQNIGYPLYQGLSPKMRCTQVSHKLQALTGACLAIRARDFARVQGFDCRYINSQEDIDLCLRLIELRGYRYCLSVGSSEVIHKEGRSPGRYGHKLWSRHQFARRWSGRIEADDAKIYAEDGMEIERLIADRSNITAEGIGVSKVQFKTRP